MMRGWLSCRTACMALAAFVISSAALAADNGEGESQRSGLAFSLAEDGSIPAWLGCGPFENTPMLSPGVFDLKRERIGFDRDWLRAIGGERRCAPEIGTTVPHPTLSPCVWKPIAVGPDGKLNFMEHFFPNMQVVAYVFAIVHSPETRTAEMRIGSDDGVKVWLNGRKVHDNPAARGWRRDSDVVRVRLHKGPNRLLIKVDQLVMDWALSVRLVDDLDRPLRDVRIELPGNENDEQIAKMMYNAATVELDRPALTAGDELRIRLGLGPSAPLTTDHVWAAARVIDRAGTVVAQLAPMPLHGDGVRSVEIPPWRAEGLENGPYAVHVGFATADNQFLGIHVAGFFFVDSYGQRLREAKAQLREAAAGLKDREGVLYSITLPSLERLIVDAEERWGALQNVTSDLAFIFSQLDKAKKGAAALAEGRDWFADQHGHAVKAYRSKVDGTLQPYSVYVPRNYDSSRSWPLVVGLHASGSNHWLMMRRLFGVGNRPGESEAQAKRRMPPLPDVPMLAVCPNGRGNSFGFSGLGEDDVWRAIADVKRVYNVDESRIYLTGFSMGGRGTWDLGLKYPDRFAAIAPVAGLTHYRFTRNWPKESNPAMFFLLEATSPLNSAENALNLPIHVFHGANDPAVWPANSDAMFERLSELSQTPAYTKYANASHNVWDRAWARASIFDWFAQYRRVEFPRRVIYKAVVDKPIGAYWVRIDAPVDWRRFSTVEAEVKPNNLVEVRVENVRRFSLLPRRPLVNINATVAVAIDGKTLPRVWIEEGKPLMFERAEDGFRRVYEPFAPPLVSTFGREAFQSWHIYVYGVSGSIEEARINREAALRAADWGGRADVDWPVKSDAELSEEELHSTNLVLFGTPANNRVLARLADGFPIEICADSIQLGRRRWRGGRAALNMVCRNPLAPENWIMINSAFSEAGYLNLDREIPHGAPDYLIFNAKGRLARAGLLEIK